MLRPRIVSPYKRLLPELQPTRPGYLPGIRSLRSLRNLLQLLKRFDRYCEGFKGGIQRRSRSFGKGLSVRSRSNSLNCANKSREARFATVASMCLKAIAFARL